MRDSSNLYFAVLVEAYVGTWCCYEPRIAGWQLCENARNSHSLAARMHWKDGGTVTVCIDLSNGPRELKVCFTLVASSTDRIVGARAATAEEVIASVKENAKKTNNQGHSVFLFVGTAATQLFDYTAKMWMGMWRIYGIARPART